MNENLLYIREKLLNMPKNIFSIPHQVNNYTHVLNLWKNYKKKGYNSNYTVRSIFKIHLEDPEHIIMYYSKNMDNILLMCKKNEIYFNYKIPYLTFKDSKIKKMKNTNFIAIYK